MLVCVRGRDIFTRRQEPEQWTVSTTLVICLSVDWTCSGGNAKTKAFNSLSYITTTLSTLSAHNTIAGPARPPPPLVRFYRLLLVCMIPYWLRLALARPTVWITKILIGSRQWQSGGRQHPPSLLCRPAANNSNYKIVKIININTSNINMIINLLYTYEVLCHRCPLSSFPEKLMSTLNHRINEQCFYHLR